MKNIKMKSSKRRKMCLIYNNRFPALADDF